MFAKFGSISHGTLRAEDLLGTFADELERLDKLAAEEGERTTNANRATTELLAHSGTLHAHSKLVAEARETDPDSEDASDVIAELEDALNGYAPSYGYFGAHPGDGANFGFWLSESLEEDFDGLRVPDTSEVPKDYSGEVLHVNDHGNYTLYVANAGKLTEVWAVV